MVFDEMDEAIKKAEGWDDKQLEEELRRHSQVLELGYRVEELKAVIIKELRLEPMVKFLQAIIKEHSGKIK